METQETLYGECKQEVANKQDRCNASYAQKKALLGVMSNSTTFRVTFSLYISYSVATGVALDVSWFD